MTELLIEKRYLKIPVRYAAGPSSITLCVSGIPQYRFEASLDNTQPNTVYFADLRCYLGQTVTLTVEPDLGFRPEFCDGPEPAPEHELRPAIHFTAPRGWINDPNGLCLYNGTYHLFYQHNPYGRSWGNMHWGHAVSKDLFHWEHREEALLSDHFGMMFSGSAVIDRENSSGLRQGTEDPILFFYSCTEEKGFTQRLAYSTDGGKTLIKYNDRPLLECITPANRDPKVIYDADRARWLMVLYLDGSTYELFTSQNLLDWTPLQTLDLPEDNECPDFYPLTADDGRRLWIFSGAHDRYLVGDFAADGRYQPIQTAGRLSYETKSYAAQTYYCEPDQPTIRFSWNTSDIPGAPFNGSLCTPTEMGLRRIGERYFLTALPIPGINTLVQKEQTMHAVSGTVELTAESKACRIEITADDTPFCCNVRGLEIQATSEGVKCGTALLPRAERETRLQIISDTVSTELYLNGTAITAAAHLADYTQPALRLQTDGLIGTVRLQELCL